MAEEIPRYTLAEAQAELTRRDCQRDGHPVRDNRDVYGGWVQLAINPPPPSTYSGPDPVRRGPLTCRCGKYRWIPEETST